ncbi:hypothetical protein [Bacillus suaedae]|uniref:Uncharacterized protein n=1 Tax=Halalkalibacter suaedae TaxID=2822140 RepID=A0A940X0U8_9BACI|nr:hypothetical protein [Bacillus suaedae]MBP3953271.1 hypothetical protein [Bacillus suaedae]
MSEVHSSEGISLLAKNELMDAHLSTLESITSLEIHELISQIYGINLSIVPLLTRHIKTESQLDSNDPHVLLDSHISQSAQPLTGKTIRNAINEFFGINLAGLASIERSRISLFTKGQWMMQRENDLIHLHTGPMDIDVTISVTEYFAKHTGINQIPVPLRQSLSNLGYQFIEDSGTCYYSDPNGHSVPDEFKGKTFGAIIEILSNDYSHL